MKHLEDWTTTRKSEELKAKVAELSKAYEESKEATGENSGKQRN